MTKGDRFERLNPVTNTKEIFTYTGAEREIKDVNFHFFEDEEGQMSLWIPSEIEETFVKLPTNNN